MNKIPDSSAYKWSSALINAKLYDESGNVKHDFGSASCSNEAYGCSLSGGTFYVYPRDYILTNWAHWPGNTSYNPRYSASHTVTGKYIYFTN